MKTNTSSPHPVPTRLSSYESAPNVRQAMLALQAAADGGSLERSLLELVKMRASQINHCAFCINMHYRAALKQGESAIHVVRNPDKLQHLKIPLRADVRAG